MFLLLDIISTDLVAATDAGVTRESARRPSSRCT